MLRATRRSVLRGRTAADASASYFGQYDSRNNITAGSWMRYEAVLNLDTGRYTATYADLGTSHPTPDTAGGSPVAFHRWESDNSQSSFYFANPMTAGTGGIAGLAFYVRGLKKASSDNAPMFDNIVVSWKAPGASDFASVYENDFSTRRYRQVEPAGTTSGAYVPVPTTNIVQSSFYERGQPQKRLRRKRRRRPPPRSRRRSLRRAGRLAPHRRRRLLHDGRSE